MKGIRLRGQHKSNKSHQTLIDPSLLPLAFTSNLPLLVPPNPRFQARKNGLIFPRSHSIIIIAFTTASTTKQWTGPRGGTLNFAQPSLHPSWLLL